MRTISRPLTMCGVLAVLAAAGATVVEDRYWLPAPQVMAELKDETGDYFGNPWQMAALPGGGFVLNDGGVTVRAFDSDGSIRWEFGRSGGGPGEFRAIRDMAVTAEETVLVLDSEAARITILEAATGELVETVRIGREASAGVNEILSVASPHLAIVQHGGTDDGNWSVLDATGEVVRTRSYPPPCESLACEAFSAGVTEDGSGVLAFRWSSDLVFLNTNGSVRVVRDGIEPIRMPEPVSQEVDPEELGLPAFSQIVVTKVDPQATEATKALAVGGLRAFVLAQGSTDNRGRVVDVYDTVEGEYDGSFLLPRPVSQIAVVDEGVLATLSTDLFPIVTLWSLRGL